MRQALGRGSPRGPRRSSKRVRWRTTDPVSGQRPLRHTSGNSRDSHADRPGQGQRPSPNGYPCGPSCTGNTGLSSSRILYYVALPLPANSAYRMPIAWPSVGLDSTCCYAIDYTDAGRPRVTRTPGTSMLVKALCAEDEYARSSAGYVRAAPSALGLRADRGLLEFFVPLSIIKI